MGYKLSCRLLWLAALSSFLPFWIQAGLAPHEVLVLVNQNSQRSMEVANHFVDIRQVPSRNVIYLDLPESVLEPKSEMSAADFTRYIWTPAQAVIEDRALHHILAWVYSVDFPVRITGPVNVSLMGPTFLRNELPADRDLIEKGLFRSLLYRGPDQPDGEMLPGASLMRFKDALGDQMPLPSMLLGFCGARGTDTDTVIRSIQYGQLSDRSAPKGTVYWLTHDDVRTRIREWQFPIAAGELAAVPLRSVVKQKSMDPVTDIIGFQAGIDQVDTAHVGRHLPGSMAEHLTSHAAEFHLPIQTKLTDWIRAGATASAGTVTEPYAIWTKFPHARFFSHYSQGHTMLESFYLSLRSPLQTLLVGEPLARPWAAPMSLTLISLEEGTLRGEASFVAALMPSFPPGQIEYHFLVNGVHVGKGAGSDRLSFDTRQLPDGWHELRAIAYIRSPTVHTATARLDLNIQNSGRYVSVLDADSIKELDLYKPFSLTIESGENPDVIRLVHNERVLEEIEDSAGEFNVDPLVLGAGPVSLHVEAVYTDGMTVRSTPVRVQIARLPPPAVRALRAGEATEVRNKPEWTKDIVACARRPAASSIELVPVDRDTFCIALFDAPTMDIVDTLSLRLMIPSARVEHPNTERAGIIFNYQNEGHFDFFVLHGHPSAWSFGRYRNGTFRYDVNRGSLILRNTLHQIDLIFGEDGVTAYVNNEFIASQSYAGENQRMGRMGLFAARMPARFKDILWD